MQVAEAVEQYIVDLVTATRQPANTATNWVSWIDTGSSPRASISLHRACRASAWLEHATMSRPKTCSSVLHAIMRHRLIMTYDALADRVTPDQIIDEILQQVAVG